MTQQDPLYLTIKELAAILRVDHKTIRNAIRDGRIEAVRAHFRDIEAQELKESTKSLESQIDATILEMAAFMEEVEAGKHETAKKRVNDPDWGEVDEYAAKRFKVWIGDHARR
ncbi:MAG: helix-turn-helix domain-containing protein [Chloroflexota bacterium]